MFLIFNCIDPSLTLHRGNFNWIWLSLFRHRNVTDQHFHALADHTKLFVDDEGETAQGKMKAPESAQTRSQSASSKRPRVPPPPPRLQRPPLRDSYLYPGFLFPCVSGLVFVVGMLVAWSGLYHYKGTWNMERARTSKYDVKDIMPLVPTSESTTSKAKTHYFLWKVVELQNLGWERYESFEQKMDQVAAESGQSVANMPTFLFVPGNQGSWKQILNAALFYQKGSYSPHGANFFSLDFNEQPTAFSPRILRSQADFLGAAIFKLTDRRKRWDGVKGKKSKRPSSLTVVAHSMGFLALKHAIHRFPRLKKRIDYVFCYSCVQTYHPFLFLGKEMASLVSSSASALGSVSSGTSAPTSTFENIKVFGISSGWRDELLAPEYTCRADNAIVPTVTMKNVYEDQTHVSLLFSRSVLHRAATISLPQLSRPRRKKAKNAGEEGKKDKDGEEDEQGPQSAGDASIIQQEDQGFADAVDSLRSPFFRLNSLFAEVGNGDGGMRKHLLQTHTRHKLRKSDNADANTNAELARLRRGEGVLDLAKLDALFEPVRGSSAGAGMENGKETGGAGEVAEKTASKEKPPLYEWEVQGSEEPFVLVVQKDFAAAAKARNAGSDTGSASMALPAKFPGGEPNDDFDPDDLIYCHDEVKVYARYFDLSEENKKKGPKFVPRKKSDFVETWAQIMPVGSLSYPQKLCVYVVRNHVIAQQPDGTRPGSQTRTGSEARKNRRIPRAQLEFDVSRLVAIGPGDAYFDDGKAEGGGRDSAAEKKEVVAEQVADKDNGSAKKKNAVGDSKWEFRIRGLAAHRETWNVESLRSLSFLDWVRALFYGIQIVPEDAPHLFQWLVMSKDEIDFDLFPFDFYSAAAENDPQTTSVGMAWDSGGNLASIGRIGSGSSAVASDGFSSLTLSTFRNAVFLDAESNPYVWAPRFAHSGHCKEAHGEPVIFFASTPSTGATGDKQAGTSTASSGASLEEQEQELIQAKAQEIFARKGIAVPQDMSGARNIKLKDFFTPEDERELQEAVEKFRRRRGYSGGAGAGATPGVAAQSASLFNMDRLEAILLEPLLRTLRQLSSLVGLAVVFDSVAARLLSAFMSQDNALRLVNSVSGLAGSSASSSASAPGGDRQTPGLGRRSVFLAVLNLRRGDAIYAKANFWSCLKQVFRVYFPYFFTILLASSLFILARLPGFHPLGRRSVARQGSAFFLSVLPEFATFVWAFYLLSSPALAHDAGAPGAEVLATMKNKLEGWMSYVRQRGEVAIPAGGAVDSYELIEKDFNLVLLYVLAVLGFGATVFLFLVLEGLDDFCSGKMFRWTYWNIRNSAVAEAENEALGVREGSESAENPPSRNLQTQHVASWSLVSEDAGAVIRRSAEDTPAGPGAGRQNHHDEDKMHTNDSSAAAASSSSASSPEKAAEDTTIGRTNTNTPAEADADVMEDDRVFSTAEVDLSARRFIFYDALPLILLGAAVYMTTNDGIFVAFLFIISRDILVFLLLLLRVPEIATAVWAAINEPSTKLPFAESAHSVSALRASAFGASKNRPPLEEDGAGAEEAALSLTSAAQQIAPLLLASAYVVFRRFFNGNAERRYWVSLAQLAHLRNPIVRADMLIYLLAYIAPAYVRHRLYLAEDVLILTFSLLSLAMGWLLSNASRTVGSRSKPSQASSSGALQSAK